MRAALYARVSTAEQAEEGHSVEAQLDLMRAHCERASWQVVGDYIDLGVSGKRTERPQLDLLMREAENGRFDVVVVHKLDRFYRNLRALLDALEKLANWNVSFISIAENMDFSTPWGKLALVNLGILAEIYLDNLAAETSKGKRQRARKGQTNASILPCGYVRDGDDNVVIEPFEAEGVRMAFERYAQGDVSIMELAHMLNQAGYRSRHRTNSKPHLWCKDSLKNTLRNPFYAGLVRHDKDEFEGSHEPIISRALWEKTVQVRKRRTRTGGRLEPVHFYLLSGLLYCARCGSRLRAHATTENYGVSRRYRDTSKERDANCGSQVRSILARIAEGQVEQLVLDFQLPDEWRVRVMECLEEKKDKRDMEVERAALQDRLQRLARAYIDAGMSEAEYRNERNALQDKLNALHEPQVTAVLDAGELLSNFGLIWQHASPQEQRAMLRIVFEAVYIDLDARMVVGLRPRAAFEPLLAMGKLADLCRFEAYQLGSPCPW